MKVEISGVRKRRNGNTYVCKITYHKENGDIQETYIHGKSIEDVNERIAQQYEQIKLEYGEA